MLLPDLFDKFLFESADALQPGGALADDLADAIGDYLHSQGYNLTDDGVTIVSVTPKDGEYIATSTFNTEEGKTGKVKIVFTSNTDKGRLDNFEVVMQGGLSLK